MLTEQDLAVLKAPFAPHELRFFVLSEKQAEDGSYWLTLQAYAPTPLIEERLDKVDPAWSVDFVTVEAATAKARARGAKGTDETKGFFVVARLTVKGTSRVGIGFDADPRIAATFAFKNAAGRFGVGRYLEGPEWRRRKRITDERIYRKLSYARDMSWDEAMNLVEEQGGEKASPKPSPRKPVADEEEIPF